MARVDSLHGLGILKVRDDWRGMKGKWHWVVAFRHQEFGVVVFDPHETAPCFENMPLDELCIDFRFYEPKGEWLQVEQSFPLEYSGTAGGAKGRSNVANEEKTL